MNLFRNRTPHDECRISPRVFFYFVNVNEAESGKADKRPPSDLAEVLGFSRIEVNITITFICTLIEVISHMAFFYLVEFFLAALELS